MGHCFHRWLSLQDIEAEWRLGQGQTQQSLVRRKLRQEMDWEREWRWYEPGIERLNGFSFSRIFKKRDPATDQTRSHVSLVKGGGQSRISGL